MLNGKYSLCRYLKLTNRNIQTVIIYHLPTKVMLAGLRGFDETTFFIDILTSLRAAKIGFIHINHRSWNSRLIFTAHSEAHATPKHTLSLYQQYG